MSDKIIKEGWTWKPEDMFIQGYGAEDQTPFQNLYTMKKETDLNYETPAVLPVSNVDYFRPSEYYRSFFARYSPYSLESSPLGDMHAYMETSWNTNEQYIEKLTTYTKGVFFVHDITQVKFRDDSDNRITHVNVCTINRYAYDVRGRGLDKLDIYTLPFTRDGDFITVDTTIISKLQGHRVIWGFGVENRELPLNLYQMTFLKEDTVRELMNVDASLPVTFTYVK